MICAKQNCCNFLTPSQARFCCQEHTRAGRSLAACIICGATIKRHSRKTCSNKCAAAARWRKMNSARDEKLLEEFASGKSNTELGASYGLARKTLAKIRKRLGADQAHRRGGTGAGRLYTPEQRAIMKSQYGRAPAAAVMVAMNAVPGGYIVTSETKLYNLARKMGLVAKRNSRPKPAPRQRQQHQRAPMTKPLASRPISLPLREIYRMGLELRLMDIAVSTDPTEISAAWRRVHPGHPGFVVAARIDWSAAP